ncbi:membrane protein [Streptomyces bikiniensis]|uniref:membrane protein n=1 Tax=Streptomyces bikiniensis TaxID=1896 RepID=UPI0004C2868C|nr:membrane protein [Streptomyces bikiniensis]
MSNDQYYGGQPDPYAGGQRPYDPYAGGQQDPDVTQTWEGQTWDTQYQPAVRPGPHGEQPYAPEPYGAQAYEPQQAYGEQAYGQQAYGEQPQAQPYEQPRYEQQPQYGQQSYGQPQPQPQPYGDQPSAPQPYAGAYRPQQTAAPAPAHTPAPVPAPAPAPAPAPGLDDGPAYSSPTTSGNTRITDAQRARAEGRSPVIEPGMQPAALTATLGLLIAGGAALGPYGLLLPLVLLQALTAAGWFRLNGMWPARQGIALAFAGGLVADGVLLAAGRENAAPAILGTLGVWVLLCLVLQLRSHADPDERMYGLMATVVSAALTVVATGHLGADPDAVVVGGVAVAAAVLAKALPLPGPVSVVAALLASAGAGIAAGGLTDPGASGALLGLGAGVCALVGLRAASYDYPSRFVHMTAGVALPLTAAAPAVYLLGRALA